MVDNFDKIRKLLEFESDDDFYFIQILQRKKDNPFGHLGNNNSSRVIKAYYIKSLKHFDQRKDEMIKLAEVFNARVGINLNKRSFYKTSFNTMKVIAEQMINKAFNQIPHAWNRSCGLHNGGDRIWLLDFDYIPTNPDWYLDIRGFLYGLNPVGVNKILDFIPSKNGVHVITKPFDLRGFQEKYPDVEIHKNNPTNLYIPWQ